MQNYRVLNLFKFGYKSQASTVSRIIAVLVTTTFFHPEHFTCPRIQILFLLTKKSMPMGSSSRVPEGELSYSGECEKEQLVLHVSLCILGVNRAQVGGVGGGEMVV